MFLQRALGDFNDPVQVKALAEQPTLDAAGVSIIGRSPDPDKQRESNWADDAELAVFGLSEHVLVPSPFQQLRHAHLRERLRRGVEHQHVGVMGVQPIHGPVHHGAAFNLRPAPDPVGEPRRHGLRRREHLPLPGVLFEELVGRQRGDVQVPDEGVVDGGLPRVAADQEEVPVAAVGDGPSRGGGVFVGEAGEEEIAAADESGELAVGAADGDEGRHGWAFVVEEDAEERRRVEGEEVAAEGRGRAHGADEGAAGEGGAGEGRERREAEEDLAEEIVGESEHGGGAFGWRQFLGGHRFHWEGKGRGMERNSGAPFLSVAGRPARQLIFGAAHQKKTCLRFEHESRGGSDNERITIPQDHRNLSSTLLARLLYTEIVDSKAMEVKAIMHKVK
ncbi:hypothetical protein BRADI_3g04611v3, partial [Brachypodium distachyon]